MYPLTLQDFRIFAQFRVEVYLTTMQAAGGTLVRRHAPTTQGSAGRKMISPSVEDTCTVRRCVAGTRRSAPAARVTVPT